MDESYKQSVLRWRAERDAVIRAENGWLSVAGLFWLKPGENTVGSDASSDIVLPARAPDNLGKFIFDEKQVRFQPAPGQSVEINKQAVSEEVPLRPDVDDDPSYLTLDTLRLVVIERPNGTGIRLWDNLRPERRIFPPREWFPINEKYRLPARYLRYTTPKKVTLPDTFGEMQAGTMDGQVTFELDGRMFDLDVTELEDHRLYIQFRDLTSGKETYPTGRYYYTLDPVADGRITLDFNFSYSPPCAFTDHATCLFAPEQNFVNARLEAGEYYRGHG
jgi:uncharacterized protein (DUF1684 family)